MINPTEIKQKLGKHTEQLETSLAPYYTNLEPWQRGLLLITLTLFLLFAIYYLTKSPSTKLNPKKEQEIEEKLMRQMAFFKRLKE